MICKGSVVHLRRHNISDHLFNKHKEGKKDAQNFNPRSRYRLFLYQYTRLQQMASPRAPFEQLDSAKTAKNLLHKERAAG